MVTVVAGQLINPLNVTFVVVLTLVVVLILKLVFVFVCVAVTLTTLPHLGSNCLHRIRNFALTNHVEIYTCVEPDSCVLGDDEIAIVDGGS